MKRLIILSIVLLAFLMGCGSNDSKLVNLKCVDTMVIYLDSNSSKYRQSGVYKIVKYVYDYEYRDSMLAGGAEDYETLTGYNKYINEWYDTVSVVYIDYSNYPRRED